jgi:hypothetical protein
MVQMVLAVALLILDICYVVQVLQQEVVGGARLEVSEGLIAERST